MPLSNGKVITPEEAIKKGLCPETGESLKGDDIEARIARLWPGQKSVEAVQRIDMLRGYAKNNKPATDVE